jgi:hypothetical protein
MKKCSKCKETKLVSLFPKTKANKDGLSYICTDCNRLANKSYREKHHERYYANQQNYRATPEGFVPNLVQNARTRASKKNIPFEITNQDIYDLMAAQEMKCAVSGIEMTLESLNRKKANPYKCSLDQIEAGSGYTIDNVRLVCWAVNQMKADRTDEEFKFWIERLHMAISSQAS